MWGRLVRQRAVVRMVAKRRWCGAQGVWEVWETNDLGARASWLMV